MPAIGEIVGIGIPATGLPGAFRRTRDAEEIPASLEYKVPRVPRARLASKAPVVTRVRQVYKGCIVKEIGRMKWF
ncbi:hypothetical protein TOPH_09105 [Tolypocladium ophioglossoides CBS 100239]|uniref:Uncharacterized protein n=1 Tax=Tolypocladium ophioglossoides (strain CBS 100239) TaxID=1163406 RepID=A0A0L0MXR5_TOLOC|nr:hypothetical protein TOPH_09105 [Tolypocladium ophioglossoides CBS 100239]